MTPIPYREKDMDSVILFGEDGTEYQGKYLDMRIDRATIPHGLHAYDCRHDDNDDWISPVTIEKRVIVNFAGTFVTKTPLHFPDEQHPCIPLKDWTLV